MRSLASLMVLAGALSGGTPVVPRSLRPDPRRTDGRVSSPRKVSCPRCQAEVGQPCDARTLGRHPYHLARVERFEAALEVARHLERGQVDDDTD